MHITNHECVLSRSVYRLLRIRWFHTLPALWENIVLLERNYIVPDFQSISYRDVYIKDTTYPIAPMPFVWFLFVVCIYIYIYDPACTGQARPLTLDLKY